MAPLMPTYEYLCPSGHEFEKFQKMSGRPRVKCPVCGRLAAAEDLRWGRARVQGQRILYHGLRQGRQGAPETGQRGYARRRPRPRKAGKKDTPAKPRVRSPTRKPHRERRHPLGTRAGCGRDRRARVRRSCWSAPATPATGTWRRNLAMVAARTLRTNPRKLAEQVLAELPSALERGSPYGDRRARGSSISGWRGTSSAGCSTGSCVRGTPTGGRLSVRVNGSTWSSSRPIPPVRCTSVMAAGPRWEMRSPHCWNGPGTK